MKIPSRTRNRRGGAAADFLTDLSSNKPNLGRDFHVGFIPNGGMMRPSNIEHDPEKWTPVFRKNHAQINS
jgi:hypothetical protein